MSPKSFFKQRFLHFSLFSLGAVGLINGGCTVAAKNSETGSGEKTSAQSEITEKNLSPAQNLTKNSVSKSTIKFAQGSPADTVRVFYKNLRERRFREAMMMTNLRPAIENLTAAEMQDLNADFEPLAKQVPAELEINGEIITNNKATVTAKMPGEEDGKTELKEIQLRRERDTWVILSADESTEAEVKKEGKNYFFGLRIAVHHAEAQNMMERIAKAQTVYALQNQGKFADMKTLIDKGLLPDDIQTSASTGYRYNLVVTPNNKKYFATADPAVYGKSGKLSFLLESDGASEKSRFKSADNKGLPLKK